MFSLDSLHGGGLFLGLVALGFEGAFLCEGLDCGCVVRPLLGVVTLDGPLPSACFLSSDTYVLGLGLLAMFWQLACRVYGKLLYVYLCPRVYPLYGNRLNQQM